VVLAPRQERTLLLGLGVLLVNRNEALPLHLKTARHGGYSLENKIAAEATLQIP
jgi:hypothetical protein